MSAHLRRSVRKLLREVRAGEIERETLDDVELSLTISANCQQQRLFTPKLAQLAALVEALQGFKRPDSPHFVGCPGQRTGGVCTAACANARAALDPALVDVVQGLVACLDRENKAFRRERARHGELLRKARHYYRDLIKQICAETGYVMRGPGRPKNPTGASVLPSSAGNTGCPGS